MNVQPDQRLQDAPGWLLWRAVPGAPGERVQKMPFYAGGGARTHNGTAADRAALVTYPEALAALLRGRFDGVGFAPLPGLGVVALDFDDCVDDAGVPADDVLDAIADTYAEISPSGRGVRAFYFGEYPSGRDNSNKARGAKLEVFGTSGYVTFTGNAINNVPVADIAQSATKALLDSRLGLGAPLDDNDAALLFSKLGVTLDRANEAVTKLDADCSYEEWLRVGQALHHEFDGATEAFDVYLNWSKTAKEKFSGESSVREKWRSFGDHRGAPVTMASVLGMLKERGALAEWRAAEAVDSLDKWRQEIDGATVRDLMTRVMPAIAQDASVSELGRASLASRIVEALKALGERIPLATIRKSIALAKSARPTFEIHIPDWAADWVYVTDKDKFYQHGTGEWATQMGFNAKHQRHMRGRDDEMQASAFALDFLQIPVVTRGLYVPFVSEPTFEWGAGDSRTTVVNTYRHNSVPKAAEKITPRGQAAVDLVLRHIDMICGGRSRERELLLSWMAYNVQNPGRKIRWAPIIKGVEGDGKTVLGKLMGCVMGAENVRQVIPRVLMSDFTSWAEGACLVIAEELRMTGHNRYDVFNLLKPYITNDDVSVHKKGRDAYDSINVSNMLCFTNFGDALPLTENDRRVMVIFTPFDNAAQLSVAIGAMPDSRKISQESFQGKAPLKSPPLSAYFAALHKSIEDQAPYLRRWLLDYHMHEEFDANGRAPWTDEKGYMIALSVNPEEELIRSIIDDGGAGISNNVIVTHNLIERMRMSSMIDFDVKIPAISAALKRMGWIKFPGKVWWKGGANNVWTRELPIGDTAAVRTALEATEQDDPFA